MSYTWINTTLPNVRYREHPKRKQRSGQPDRYYTVRYYVNGERKEEGLGWASEGWNPEKAYKVLSQIKASIKTGEGPASLSDMRREGEKRREAQELELKRESLAEITLRDFLSLHFIPRIKKEKRSWEKDEERINNHIIPALGAFPLRAVSREQIQAFLDEKAEKYAPATVLHFVAVLRRAFNVAAITSVEGVLLFSGANPATKKWLRLPDVKNERLRFLSSEEADTLIHAARKKGRSTADLHDAIIISLNTGLRMGEILRLEWVDVDLVHGFVTVRDESHRKPGGVVPLNSEAVAVFKERLSRREEGPLTHVVFPAQWGKSWENLSHAFKALADGAGLNDGIAENDRQRRVVFHTLRHTFASWLALKGTDIYRIKTLMRHKTISMTMRYAHLIPDATRSAVHDLRPPKAKGS